MMEENVMKYEIQADRVIKRIREISKVEKLRLRIDSDWEIKQYVAGKQGEEQLSMVIKEHFPDMTLIDDIYIDVSKVEKAVSGHAPSMQIDHILISNHAMYIIETKKYSKNATVKGSSNVINWEYKDDEVKKTRRENACRQNSRHIDKLKRVLTSALPKNVVSIVCLVNMIPENIQVSPQYGQYVFTIEELPYMLKALEEKYSQDVFDAEDRKNVIDEINRLNQKSFEQEVNHIVYVKLLKRHIRNLNKSKRKKKRQS